VSEVSEDMEEVENPKSDNENPAKTNDDGQIWREKYRNGHFMACIKSI
jgi:hypothetical protein